MGKSGGKKINTIKVDEKLASRQIRFNSTINSFVIPGKKLKYLNYEYCGCAVVVDRL